MLDLAPHLDRQGPAFGKVVKGMEFVDKTKKGDGPNGAVQILIKLSALDQKNKLNAT